MSLSLRTALAASILIATTANAQPTPADRTQIIKLVDANAPEYKQVSKEIWGFAELGYHENKSSTLLQDQLKKAGFTIQAGVADEPTAFVASYGSGKPVIAILGEFDALPGLSQQAVATREPVVNGAPGHGCGHNLLGSGAALAAVATKEFMAEHHITGTLRYYGTPAEEGGSGKIYMVRAGLFKDVDVVLQWHPGRPQRRRTTEARSPSPLPASPSMELPPTPLWRPTAAAPRSTRHAHGQRHRVPPRARPRQHAHPLRHHQRRRSS